MKAIKFTILILIAVLFSCKKPTLFKEIEVNNLFSLQIPVYLQTTNDLVPITAQNIHQYEDSTKKICLLIFDTSRIGIQPSTLKAFYDSMVATPLLDSITITPPELIKVDNDSAYRSEITGILNGIRVFSEIETIATKERYYYIQTWSSMDMEKQSKPDMYKMLSSFQDISHSKK